MRALVLLVGIALLAATSAQATVRRGEVHGMVRRGPIAPVCVVGQACDEPAPGVTLLFSRKGHVAGRAVSDAEGRYSVRLAAGHYAVSQPSPPEIGRGIEPRTVRVYAGHRRRVDFSIDTGIR